MDKIKKIKELQQEAYEERQKFQELFDSIPAEQFELKCTYQIALQVCNAEYEAYKKILKIFEENT